jgi:RNA polymerase sigma factor (sigma-70 family)
MTDAGSVAAAPVSAPMLARATRSSRWMADEQLARLASNGNEHAFAAIYERYLPKLVRYCQGIVLSREDAEDAAQTAMVKAMKALAERPQEINLRPWLYRIAHNEAISLLRRRRPTQELDETVELVAGQSPEEVADTRMRLRELVTDLRALPERQRGALVMRELCGLEYEEIAGALGSSRGAAMQTVFEARSALVQFDEGRRLPCELVQRAISDGDRRRLRGRGVRAHLRGCDQCRGFESALQRRRGDLALLVPAGGKGLIVTLLGLAGVGGARTAVSLSSVSSLGGSGWRVAAVGLIAATAAGGEAVNQLSVGHHDHHTAPAVASGLAGHAAAAARAAALRAAADAATRPHRAHRSTAAERAGRPHAVLPSLSTSSLTPRRAHRERALAGPPPASTTASAAAPSTSAAPSSGSGSGAGTPSTSKPSGSSSSNSFWSWVLQQAAAQAAHDASTGASSAVDQRYGNWTITYGSGSSSASSSSSAGSVASPGSSGVTTGTGPTGPTGPSGPAQITNSQISSD